MKTLTISEREKHGNSLRLWQFIHRPIILASVHNHNAGESTARTVLRSGDEHNRELVAPAFHELAATDLIG
jgi:hypothetical protein